MKNNDVIFIDSGDDDDDDKKNHFDEDNEKDYSAYNVSTDDDNEYKPLSPFSYETTDDRMDDYQYKPLSPFSYETTDDRMDDYQYKPLSPFSYEITDDRMDDYQYKPLSPFSYERTDDRMNDYQYKPLSPFSYETTDDRMDDYQYKPLSPFSYETTDDRMDDYQYKPLSPFSNETSDVDDCEYNPSSPFSDTSSNSSLAPSRKLCRHPDVWPDSAFNDDGKPISSVFKNFYRLTPVKCDKGIPFDIDGLGIYVVSLCRAKIYSVKDGRPPWNKDVRTKWAGFSSGSVRRATCKGDLKCSNVNCLYWTEFGHPNTTQFETKKNEKICAICQYAVENQFCGAQRYVIYMENTAIVCHEGNHTCTATEPLDINKDEIK